MRKNLRLGLLCIVAVAVVAAGCGGGGTGPAEDGSVQDAVATEGVSDVATGDIPVVGDVTGDLAGDADTAVELPPDTVPPLVKIVSPKDGAVVSGQQTIVVDATDDRGVAVVDVYLEDALLGSVTVEPWELAWDTTGLATGNYRLVAVATDAAGNSAQDEVVVLVQGSCDETGDCPPKSVKIITPVGGAKVCGTVTIEATAQDDYGITEVEFLVDGDSLGVDVESPYQKDWDTTKTSKGEHLVKVIARDTVGHEAFASVTVEVDNSGGSCDNLPNVFIEQPKDGDYLYGTVDVVAKASDDIGVVKVQFFIDNALVTEDNTVPYKTEWDTEDFDEGAHTLKAIAYDTGNQMGTMQIQVTVDRTPPEVEITSPDTEGPFQDVLAAAASATDNFVVKQVELSVEYEIEPVVLTKPPFEADLDLSSVPSGTHTLVARAVDGAGHDDEAWFEILVDRPPTVAFVAPKDADIVYGKVLIDVAAADDLSTPDVEFYVDGALVDQIYDGEYLWQTEYKKAERKLKVIARDEWDQTASAEISVLVDHPVEADLQACQGASCKSLSDGTELTGIVKLKVEAKDDGAAIGKVEFHADGNLVSVDNSAPWEYSLDTETLGDGFHTLKAVAVNTLSEKGQDTAEVLVNNCDLDHDTYLAQECGGSDCEDLNPDKNPGKPDTVGNGVDDNCDGIDGIDGDGDGYASKGSGGTDCDDAKAAVNPGKPDTVGNGVDDNCDGIDGVDADGDGHASLTSGGEDCDDLNPDKNPGKPDTVGNGVDDNCDGMDGVDADGDGYASKGSGGTDCDDAKANVNPGKPDTVGNGVDDNCDGIDGVDADGDGHASLASGGKDCDDLNPNKNPGKPDTVGNGVDDNCDGIDGVDGDGDGYASKGSGGKDCDDAKGNVHPCADDVGGDGLDANCDGKDAASCDDCDPCTQDQVDGAGCKHTTMGEGQLCDDGDACTTGEKCNGGKCGGGAAVGCDDGDVCTLDACDPVSGCTHVPDPLKAGQPCPGGVCFGGACCAAACAGKECGDDGCGGSCGTCAQGKKCGPQGKCVDPTALVWKPIPGGTFMMGCSPGDGDCFSDEKPSHSVTLSPFQILETEVTEAQYFKVTGKDPSCDWGDGGGPDSPVECVDWYESKAFCEAVAPKGRLCTEAEWEYAARGGTTTKYYCGDNASCLGGIAWYGSNSGDHKHDVKGKAPNAYGLYDMLGNVWEWTADWYSSGYYSVSPANNPQGPNSGSYRVERGGGFGHDDYYLRVSYRSAGVPSDVYDGLGLRCCRSVQP